ncbi:MAG TPA: ABC transporter permease [Firmicutes bacterium]|nr:ABC transporter permease [Bacillota bacterium]
MSRVFYPKLAWTGITKNRKIYLPYILTCVGMVLMYYIVSFLSSNATVQSMPGGNEMQAILSEGCIVVAVFSLIFLFYTNSFLMRRRKKEFGLYNILGMGKINIARILFWECLIIAVIALVGGMISGILFSKIGELLMIRILGGNADFSFYISPNTVLQTVCIFGGIFLIILLNALRQIHLSNPLELLRSEAVGEKKPKANWVIAVLGIILLAGAYYLAVTLKEPVEALMWFFVAVIMVIVATYMIFISGSVALCKLLQKKKNYYYKTNHFISVSSMTYRMKRNGAGLASICILSTMVLVMIMSTASLYIGTEDSLRSRYPRNIVTDTYSINEEKNQLIEQTIVEVLQNKGVNAENLLNYRYLGVAGFFNGNKALFNDDNFSSFTGAQALNVGNYRQLFIVPLEDYNRIMGESKTLSDDEVLIYSTKSDYDYDTITLEDAGTWKVKEVVDDFIDNGNDVMSIIASVFIFVPDINYWENMLDGIVAKYGSANDLSSYKHSYYAFDLSCNDEQQIEIENEISSRLKAIEDEQQINISVEGVASERAGFYALYGGLFFLGILLGIVFIIGAVLIMYYKQITEGYEDKGRFDILQKVGMTKREIKKSINSQVLTIFFMPLIAAGLHVAFAFPLIQKILALFSLTNFWLLIGITIGCFVLFAVFYIIVYIITSRQYYNIVSTQEE